MAYVVLQLLTFLYQPFLISYEYPSAMSMSVSMSTTAPSSPIRQNISYPLSSTTLTLHIHLHQHKPISSSSLSACLSGALRKSPQLGKKKTVFERRNWAKGQPK